MIAVAEMIPEVLRSRFQKLASSVSRVRRAVSQADEMVRLTEDALRKFSMVEQAAVVIDASDIAGSAGCTRERWTLHWLESSLAIRRYRYSYIDPRLSTDDIKPFSAWPEAVKLRALAKLPELAQKVYDETVQITGRCEAAIAKLEAVFGDDFAGRDFS